MPTNPPTIAPAPEVPQRNIKATFGKLVDAFNTWKANSVSQFQAVATNVFNNATEAFNSAAAALNWSGVASDYATAAAASAGAAADSAANALAISGATPWVAGSTYQQFAVVISKVNFKAYRKTTTAAASTGGVTDPANDSANWLLLGVALGRSARTANAMLVAKDIGLFIDITSGTFTQAFDTAANLSAGWYCYLRNSGTGDITIPSSDGVNNWVMYPREVRLFQCDGVALRSIVIQSFYKVGTVSGTFVKPPCYSRFDGEMWGGGASGGAYASSGVIVYGGAGGGYVPFSFAESALAATEAYVVGAGAAAQTAANSQWGLNGGNSTFKGLTAYGANSTTGGAAFTASASGAINGPAQGSTLSLYGGASTTTTAASCHTIYGGCSGLSIDSNNLPVMSGTTQFGGPGGATAGANGVAPGGGGAGTRGATSGAGARGEFRIWGVQ